MRAIAAIGELLRESPEWRRFFKACCETGALRLRSQAWQFRNELRTRGEWFEFSELEDALLTIARKVLPETPAAAWDAKWAHELCRDVLARLAERYANLTAEDLDALEVSSQKEWDERMHAAGEANDPVSFREALSGWERAAVEALEAARSKRGTA